MGLVPYRCRNSCKLGLNCGGRAQKRLLQSAHGKVLCQVTGGHNLQCSQILERRVWVQQPCTDMSPQSLPPAVLDPSMLANQDVRSAPPPPPPSVHYFADLQQPKVSMHVRVLHQVVCCHCSKQKTIILWSSLVRADSQVYMNMPVYGTSEELDFISMGKHHGSVRLCNCRLQPTLHYPLWSAYRTHANICLQSWSHSHH